MRAIILAAGSSKRLRPLTDDTPKCLLEIGGKSLLVRNIEILHNIGIKDITIVVGFLKEHIIYKIKNIYPDVKFIDNSIFAESGSGYSLYLGLKSIEHDQDVVFMDADILYDPAIVKDIKSQPGIPFLYVKQHACDEEAVKVFTDNNGFVSKISKIADSDSSCVGESMGIVKLSSDAVLSICETSEKEIKYQNFDFEWEYLLDKNLDKLKLYTIKTTLHWIEIDFPADVVRAEKMEKQFRVM